MDRSAKYFAILLALRFADSQQWLSVTRRNLCLYRSKERISPFAGNNEVSLPLKEASQSMIDGQAWAEGLYDVSSGSQQHSFGRDA